MCASLLSHLHGNGAVCLYSDIFPLALYTRRRPAAREGVITQARGKGNPPSHLTFLLLSLLLRFLTWGHMAIATAAEKEV